MSRQVNPANPSYMILKHNTWLVRCQIPEDVRWYFGGRREYKKTTGIKKMGISRAESIRDIVVADFKNQVRLARSKLDKTISETLHENPAQNSIGGSLQEIQSLASGVGLETEIQDKGDVQNNKPDIAHTYYRVLKKKMDWLRIPSKVSKN